MTNIRLPSGQLVNFGDMAEDEITSALKVMQTDSPELFQKKEPEFDYRTATFDQAVERARTGTTGTKKEPQKRIKATNDGEVADGTFQFWYGRADSDSDREKRLTSEFGEGSFIRRGYDDYLLNLDNISAEKKAEYGLPESGTINVNRPGFSWYDVSNILGNEAAALAAATGAGLMASGVGILPGALISAAAATAGKSFDEIVIEDKLEKMNTQGDDEVYKDIALTGMLYGAGEIIGRGIFALGRKFIKGPGPEPSQKRIAQLIDENPGMTESKAAIIAREERKKELRTAIDEGARPTIEEVTGKAITGRLQAIYEGIFPNKKAAELNRRFITGKFQQYRNGEITEEGLKEALEKQAQTIRNEVNLAMRNADVDEASKIAKQHLEKVIGNEFELIKDLYNPKTGLDTTFQTLLNNAARLFDHDASVLYKKADDILARAVDKNGNSAATFSKKDLDKISKAVREIEADEAFKAGATETAFAQSLLPYIKGKESMTLTELQSLKSAIQFSSKDPGVAPSLLDKQVGQLIKSIDDTVEDKITSLASYRDSLKIPNVNREQPDFFPFLEEGLYAYNKAKKFYSNGINRFKQASIDILDKDLKAGMVIGPKEVYKAVIEANNPQKLNAFMRAIVPSGRSAAYFSKANPSTVATFREAAQLARNGEMVNAQALLKEAGVPDNLIPKIPDFAKGFKADDPYMQHIGQNFAKTMDDYAGFSAARANPLQMRDAFRDSLAREWITQNTKRASSTIDDVADTFDAPAFAQSFDELGIPMQEALFGKVNAATMRNLTRDFYIMGKNNKELSEQISKAFLEPQFARSTSAMAQGLPAQARAQTQRIRSEAERLAGDVSGDTVPVMQTGAQDSVKNSLANLKTVFELNKAQSDDALFRSIRNGNLDSPEELVTSVLTNPKNYRRLVGQFGDESLDAPANIKDAVMTRIIAGAFPDGMTTDAIAAGTWGKGMRTSIEKLNRNKALDTVLGESTVNDLIKLSRLGEQISSQSLKGKGGLAAAAFAAAAGMRLLTAPASFLLEAGTIFGLGRIFRQEWFLKSMLSPRFETPSGITAVGGRRLYQDAIEAGADIDTMNPVLMELMERSAQEFRLVNAALVGRGIETGGEIIEEEVVRPVIEEARPVVEETMEDVRRLKLPNTDPQASMLQAPRTTTPGMTASEVFRNQELQKLLGGMPT